MRNLEELNINQGGQRVTREPPSVAAISAFEREFGLEIPGQLLDVLQFSNGGHPELDSYNPSGTDDVNSFGINTFYFLTEDQQAPYNLWEAVRVWRPYIGENRLPFQHDGFMN